MKCVLIGVGYFGKIIISKLQKMNVDIITVDPFFENSDYKNILDVPFTDGKWFIATPASTHHKIICTLFDKGVKDIWVEKPLCPVFEDTLDIFARKPTDVFLYCDFTWLRHEVVETLGNYVLENGVKHLNLVWVNNSDNTPTDVDIIVDLAIHPVSIVYYLLLKNSDYVESIHLNHDTKNSVYITGKSKKGVTFTVEVSNSFVKKLRYISAYSDKVLRWSSVEEFYIEGIGELSTSDAIEKNILSFFDRVCQYNNLKIMELLNSINAD